MSLVNHHFMWYSGKISTKMMVYISKEVVMGFFSKMMNKAGSWHVKQLVQDCIKEMMGVSMSVNQQVNNPYLTDSTLDLVIEHLNAGYLKTEVSPKLCIIHLSNHA